MDRLAIKTKPLGELQVQLIKKKNTTFCQFFASSQPTANLIEPPGVKIK